ncbi:MAG: ABC transporter permease [Desulfobacteraceae bacterium]|nr:ABC transporter permease [Desulfobacteraceae bacterium]MCB9494974.1 ABC transporter permease [Desulfobacteraceae bacterium]
MRSRRIDKREIITGIFILSVIILSLIKVFSGSVFNKYLYLRTSTIKLVFDHLILVVFSSAVSGASGFICGVLFTRKSFKSFLPAVNAFSSAAQTFPPVAVLALCVPMLGFGAEPVIAALVIYGFFPVLRSTVSGLESVGEDITGTAKAMGMKNIQILLKIEIPLSAGVIIGGLRICAVIGTGTAALGAVVGAGGLGVPVISGLMNENYFHVLHGGILAAFLAVIIDAYLEKFQRFLQISGFI